MRSKSHGKVILGISDTHFPFQHKDALKFLADLKKTFKPDVVVCLGDEGDFHAISDWSTDPDGLSSGDEYRATLDALQPLFELFPNVLACTSNHTDRPFRQGYKTGLPRQFFKDYKELLNAPDGWVYRDQWIVDDILFFHGEPYTGRAAAQKAAVEKNRNCVFGHVHSNAGVHYINDGVRQRWAVNSGCLIDETAYAFRYGKHFKDRPVLGTSLIIDGVPIFIPM